MYVPAEHEAAETACSDGLEEGLVCRSPPQGDELNLRWSMNSAWFDAMKTGDSVVRCQRRLTTARVTSLTICVLAERKKQCSGSTSGKIAKWVSPTSPRDVEAMPALDTARSRWKRFATVASRP